MRIAYIAGAQPEAVVKQRSLARNLALAGTRKISLVADALALGGFDVVVFSEALPAEGSGKRYPGLVAEIGSQGVPCICSAGFDRRYWATLLGIASLLWSLVKEHRRSRFDVAVVYNFGFIQAFYMAFARFILGCRIILEYEDDATVGRYGEWTLFNQLCTFGVALVKKRIAGCFAVSERLLHQVGAPHGFVLPGVVNVPSTSDVGTFVDRDRAFMYAGSLDTSKGIDHLITAWLQWQDRHGWQLHITGDGPLRTIVQDAASSDPTIVYHGRVDQSQLETLLNRCRIAVNPHRLSRVGGNVVPFKLVEYLYHGMPVLSTLPGGLDSALLPGLILLADDSVDALVEGLLRASREVLPDISAVRNHIQTSYTVDALCDRLKTLVFDCTRR